MRASKISAKESRCVLFYFSVVLLYKIDYPFKETAYELLSDLSK